MVTKRSPFYESLRTFFFILKRERFFYILGVTLVILLGGAIALHLLESSVNKGVANFFDAIYWAVISMTTTGYGDITQSPQRDGSWPSWLSFPGFSYSPGTGRDVVPLVPLKIDQRHWDWLNLK